MTSRQLYEFLLIELNKRRAPSIMLEDFIYFSNRAINQFVNKKYNVYEIREQESDDLRVLSSTAILTPTLNTVYAGAALFSKVYEVLLPDDYLHITGCVVEYTVISSGYQCYAGNSKVIKGAKKLTADMFPTISTNYYLKPSPENPYYYINNVTTTNTYPTSDSQVSVTTDANQINRVPDNRYGNKSKVRMEIRYGFNDTTFKLSKVYVDYLKVPKYITLTQDQIDNYTDVSQVLEFPDYVCQEILNELVNIVMEYSSDPRLQTHIPISQSISQVGQVQSK